jgi:tRNA nucleotidyltransferase/poly(A) polymerase
MNLTKFFILFYLILLTFIGCGHVDCMEHEADPMSLYSIGARYYEGIGVEKDKVEAVKWFRRAAEEEGHVTAQFRLAVCYELGEGVNQDKAEVVKWFQRASEQGHVIAQFRTGVCYEKGEGVTQDKVEAARWFQKAAEQGNTSAQQRVIKLKNQLLESSIAAQQLGRYLDALVDCECCLELDPNYEPAIANRNNILQAIVQNRRTIKNSHIFSLSSIGSALLLPYSLTKKLLSFGLQFLPTILWGNTGTGGSTLPTTLNQNMNGHETQTPPIAEDSVTSDQQKFAEGSINKELGSSSLKVAMSEEEVDRESFLQTGKESELQVVIDHLRKALHERNTLTDEFERQIKNLDQERQRVRCLGESLDEQKQKTTTLEGDLAKASLKISSLKTALEKQKKESQINSSHIEQLEKDLTKHQRKSEASEKFTLKQTRKIKKLSEQVEYLQQQIGILQHDLEQGNVLKKQYDLQKQELYKNSQRTSQLEEELKEQKHKIAALEKQIRIAKNQASGQQVKVDKADGLRKKIEEETILKEQASEQVLHLEKLLKEQIDKTASLTCELERQGHMASQLKKENDLLRSQLQTFLNQFREDCSLRELCNAQTQKIQFLQGEVTRSYQHPLVLQPTIIMEGGQITQLKEQLMQMQFLYGQLQRQIAPLNVPNEMQERQRLHETIAASRTPTSFIPPLRNTSEMSVQLPSKVHNILQSFTDGNHCVLIVGGAVRDYLLRRTPADIDIITNMPSHIFMDKFKEFNVHTTPYVSGLYQMSVEGLKIDISCCDTEVFCSAPAFLKDAMSRAFTVNALYCDLNGKIYDPTQTGISDLLHHPTLRLINAGNNWFEKDPFLLLRATRLAVQNRLIVPLEIKQLIRQSNVFLKQCDQQRLFVEFKRLFLRGFALMNFEQLMELDLLRFIFPKTTEYLSNPSGIHYLEWLRSELYNSDQLVIKLEPVSTNYVYAIFLTGSVLATLSESSILSSNIEQTVNKVVNEMFHNHSKADFV